MNFWDLVLVWFAPIVIGMAIVFFFSRNKSGKESGSASELLSMIAHQFRSPLTSIKWISERLNGTRLEAEQKEKVLEIQKLSQHLIDLTSNFSKIGNTNAEVITKNRQEYYLSNLVSEIVGLLKSHAEQKHIKLVLAIKNGIEKIRTDKFLFTEAMKNILENAIEYSPSDSAIEIDVNRDGDHYLVSISNYGNAISTEEQGKIFGKHFRGSAGKAVRPDGNGLGLFIAKLAVQANKGDIYLKSPIKGDKGATFSIRLPADI